MYVTRVCKLLKVCLGAGVRTIKREEIKDESGTPSMM
jgi:hypothetical protein